MEHTGRPRMILLLGTVIKSAKPYTFSQVHAYVHSKKKCFSIALGHTLVVLEMH